jgi:hypothetical protein
LSTVLAGIVAPAAKVVLVSRNPAVSFSTFSATRVSSAIQFTSHVFPPSSEKACSKCTDVAVMSEITKRTKIAFPRNVSWS